MGPIPMGSLSLARGICLARQNMAGPYRWIANAGLPCGTVFNFLPNQTEKVVLPFNGSFGGNSSGGLTADSLGDLAIPLSDGAAGNGSVLELLANGTRRVFPFPSDGNDGSGPNGNLIADNKGNFYGTTQANVLTGGVVFQLSAGGTVSVLHNFEVGSGLSEPLLA